jgi:hypothetical protein
MVRDITARSACSSGAVSPEAPPLPRRPPAPPSRAALPRRPPLARFRSPRGWFAPLMHHPCAGTKNILRAANKLAFCNMFMARRCRAKVGGACSSPYEKAAANGSVPHCPAVEFSPAMRWGSCKLPPLYKTPKTHGYWRRAVYIGNLTQSNKATKIIRVHSWFNE